MVFCIARQGGGGEGEGGGEGGRGEDGKGEGGREGGGRMGREGGEEGTEGPLILVIDNRETSIHQRYMYMYIILL